MTEGFQQPTLAFAQKRVSSSLEKLLMPRTPVVCPAVFCPHSSNIASPILRILSPAYCRLPTASCLLRCAVGLLLLLITYHSTLITVRAQSATATLSGTVVDQNGAVVPDVKIAVISIAQGFQRSATTKEEGTFVVPLLPPGNYTVKAEHQGFTPAEVRDVVLNVNDQVAIRIHMKIGTLSQTVEIVEGTSLINESPAVGTVVDRQFVGNLPLNGRSFQSLIALTPGVVQTKINPANSTGQFSVNGQRANANYFTVDGVSANIDAPASSNVSQTIGGSLPGLSAFGGTSNLVSVDALQEFKVLTSSYAAEFGRTPGGQVQIVTRSGTNEFHGTLFNYLRNDVLDANDWFANRNKLRRPPLRQNDFGGVFSGPILLPRFGEGGRQPGYNGRNRTFFFFSYEGLRLRQPQVVSNAEVPSTGLRQSALPQIQPFLNAFAIPNGPELANGLALFSASYSNPSSLDATSIRIDHTVSNKLSLFGRYNYAPSSTIQRFRDSLTSPSLTAVVTETATVGTTSSLTSRIVNDFRANYSRTRSQNSRSLDNFGGGVPVSFSSLSSSSFTLPADSLLAFTLLFSTSPEIRQGNNARNVQRQINLVDTLSFVTGSHQLKFGIDYRRLSPTILPNEYFQQAAFTSANAARTATASLVLINAKRPARPIFTNFSAFAQDTWKAGPRLTLTYGSRWEVNPPPKSADGNDALTATGLDNPATIALAPRGTPLFKTTYNNFAPRFGIAYQLSQRTGRETVVRGGGGIFYDLGNVQGAIGFTRAPFATPSRSPLPSNVPYPNLGAAAVPPPFGVPPFFIVAADSNLKLPRTYQWNVAVEQSVGINQTVSALYVGALGRRLINRFELSNPNPTFSNVLILKNDANSDYHALQLQFQRRLWRGLQALASYTWSHSIDEVSSDIGVGLDRGPSDFDTRHAFSAAVTYNIPSPKAGRFAGAILRDWSVDSIIRAQSAAPVDVIARQFFSLAVNVVNIRPNLIQGIPLYLNDPNAPGGRRFNNTVPTAAQALAARCAPITATNAKGAFCTPPTNQQGSLGRNVLRGFPLNQVDLSLRRHFNLKERLNLLLRADVFNIFNHPNFGDPTNSLGSATFGEATTMFGRSLGAGGAGGGFNPLYQVGGPRSMQFSLKLQF